MTAGSEIKTKVEWAVDNKIMTFIARAAMIVAAGSLPVALTYLKDIHDVQRTQAHRFQELKADTANRIEGLRSEQAARIDIFKHEQGARLDDLTWQIRLLNSTVDSKFERINGDIKGMMRGFRDHEDRVRDLEKKR